MDRAAAITRLPGPYAAAVRLHDQGLDDLIADRLGIESEVVPALLRLAEAKLARVLEADQGAR